MNECGQIGSNKGNDFGLQNLTEINVSWCNLITENGVEAIARGCNKVKKFSSKGKCCEVYILL